MKLKSLVLIAIVLSSQLHSVWAINFSRLNGSLQQNNNIDFDALDEELSLLPMSEQKEENSWWITRQAKHFGAKIAIKALLGYIALQEYCSDTWDSLSRRIRNTQIRMKAFLGYIAIRKYCNDTWNSFSGKIRNFQGSVARKLKKQSYECQA